MQIIWEENRQIIKKVKNCRFFSCERLRDSKIFCNFAAKLGLL